MADAYWRYAAADPRQQQPPPPSAGGGVAHPGMGGGGAPQMAPAVGQQQQQPMKRPRPADFSDVPGAPDITGYYPRDEERAGYRPARDTEAINASYERFLRTGERVPSPRGPLAMHLTLEFGGGLELLLENSTKVHKVEVTTPNDGGQGKVTMKSLLSWVKDNLIKERPEMFVKGDSVRPGVLALINDCDWELCGGLDAELEEKDVVVFISTLHGG